MGEVSKPLRRRQSRFLPASKRSRRATARDGRILLALAKMRFLTTSQLARLYFGGSRSATNKRLRTLMDQGLVRVWARNLSEENLYSITRAGDREIQKTTEGRDHAPSPPRGPDGNLDHLLAINEVRVSLAVSLPRVRGMLTWWRSEWDLRAVGPSRLIPDALFSIRWEDGQEHSFALELDNATKSIGGFLKKMLRYEAVGISQSGLFGIFGFLILVVGREPRWVERYRDSLDEGACGGAVWFAALDDLKKEGVEGSIWTTTEGVKRYSLREISSLPYSTEGIGRETCLISG